MPRFLKSARRVRSGGHIGLIGRRLRAAAALGMACAVWAGTAQANIDRWPGETIVAPEPVVTNVTDVPKVTNVKRKAPTKKKPKAVEKAKKVPFGAIPKGPIHIVIAIDKQRLALYSNGVRVAEAPVSTGMPGYPTPTGVFSVIQKARFHRSNIYSGAPMPFMQRLTWSGVALHAGVLPGYPASHGCIRLHADFATQLFALTRLGARVIVVHNEVAPVEIAHPLLFVRKERPPAPPPVAALPTDATIGGAVRIAEATDATRASDASIADDADADTLAAAGIEAARSAARAGEADDASRLAEAAKDREILVTGELRPAIDETAPAAAKSADPAKTAATRFTVTLATGEVTPVAPAANDAPQTDAAKPPEPPRRSGPVAVFVSRKDRKVYVRQGFEPLFDAPVTIRDPDQPFGTHVYTAMEFQDDGATLRWTAVSMPGEPDVKRVQPPKGKSITEVLRERGGAKAKAAPPPPPAHSAPGVLDRIELPQEAIERISESLSPGSSLVVSDQGLGYETGKGTDFIVVTR